MNLPGFTAEASFNETDAQYILLSAFAERTDDSRVVPQSVSCIQVCNSRGCYLKCVNNPKPPGPIIA